MEKSSERKYDYCACAKQGRNQLLHDRHCPQHVVIISVVAACQEASLRPRSQSERSKKLETNAKTLKSEYNKVNNHNKISGNAPATCPFFAEMDRFLHMDRSVFPKRITKSLHIVRKGTGGPTQETSSQPSQASQHQDASTTTVVTVEVPPAISEEGNIILHLVPVKQPLGLDPHPPEDMDPQDLPSSPAASDETVISGEEPQEEATQSPGGETQATRNVGSDSPQEAAVRRAPVHTVVCWVWEEEDIPDRRARRGEIIARTIIEDSRREGCLNRTLARRQHKSLLRSIGREASSLESLAQSYRKDLAVTAWY
ncbi:hypothetical protein JD844_013396 [Phrynosoma platyrhinos]|uniref:Uncharacterized protein n=1 Tax=Phrynosoma platyrhinos TaxID=52577 RepID=A0ABQ7TKR4_PHRPL|nr:hypothetical protein JD844_013396 [Phrynosoma platyrhinos]